MAKRSKPLAKFLKELAECTKDIPPEGEPLVLYHGTCDKFANRIRARGLRDPYLALDGDLAQVFADIKADAENCKPILYKVKIHDRARLRADDEHYYTSTSYIEGLYEIEQIEDWDNLRDAGRIPMPKNDKDWLTSLCVVKSVRYEGTIPPEDVEGTL